MSPRPGDGWRDLAARAAHPSVVDDDHSWLRSIAKGLASAAAPWPVDDRSPGRITAALLLETEAYRAWSVAWPAGEVVELGETLHVHSFCVVDGELELVGGPIAGQVRTTFTASTGDVVTVPTVRLRSIAPLTTAIHVVLLGPEIEAAPLPWLGHAA